MSDAETIKIILNTVPYRGRRRNLDFSLNSKIAIPGDIEIRNMERARKKHGYFPR